jgi:hypothetical protein
MTREDIIRWARVFSPAFSPACAKVCDGYTQYGDSMTNWSVDCAAAIRARGNK